MWFFCAIYLDDQDRDIRNITMRILLAEDDVSQAESIQSWLEMDGYVIDWVARGDHAILAIEQHQYDCVLLDRGLPKASGDDILVALRSQQKNHTSYFSHRTRSAARSNPRFRFGRERLSG